MAIRFYKATTAHVYDRASPGWLTVPDLIADHSSLTPGCDVVWVRADRGIAGRSHPGYFLVSPVTDREDPQAVARSRFHADRTLAFPTSPVGDLLEDGGDVLLVASPMWDHPPVIVVPTYGTGDPETGHEWVAATANGSSTVWYRGVTIGFDASVTADELHSILDAPDGHLVWTTADRTQYHGIDSDDCLVESVPDGAQVTVRPRFF